MGQRHDGLFGAPKTPQLAGPRNFGAGKSGFGRRLFELRFRLLKLTQRQFADRFGLSYAMVRDLEQGRAKPTRAVILYVSAVETFPELMVLIARRERGP